MLSMVEYKIMKDLLV